MQKIILLSYKKSLEMYISEGRYAVEYTESTGKTLKKQLLASFMTQVEARQEYDRMAHEFNL